jgi:phosphatidylinositol-3-phosphatase
LKPSSQSLTGIVLSLTILIGAGCNSTDNQTTPLQTSPVQTVNPTTNVTASPNPAPSTSAAATPVATSTPKGIAAMNIDHIVVVVEENHSYKQIIESPDAPYMHALIQRGALFTNAHGITHPSQGNYIALFSGSTQGIKDDSCQKPFNADNLASELLKAKLTFTGYSEDLPKVGYIGCSSKGYARKHNPWVQFSNVPEELNRPLTDFPKDFSKLPTVSFVIPNHQNDMHDGTIKEADDWLKKNIDAYASWAEKNNSLLIVTWDEDDFAKANHIPLIFVGPMVKPGKYEENVNHYHVLRTIEDLYHLPALGESKKVKPITLIWR